MTPDAISNSGSPALGGVSFGGELPLHFRDEEHCGPGRHIVHISLYCPMEALLCILSLY